MKKNIAGFPKPLKYALSTLWALLLSVGALAQRPTHIPGNGEPVNFFDSLTNIVLYIIIPLLVVVLFFLWRRDLKKKQEEKEKQQENNSQ